MIHRSILVPKFESPFWKAFPTLSTVDHDHRDVAGSRQRQLVLSHLLKELKGLPDQFGKGSGKSRDGGFFMLQADTKDPKCL
jgi:hypothetical protein